MMHAVLAAAAWINLFAQAPDDNQLAREAEAYARRLGAFAERISDGLPPELPGGYGDSGFDEFPHLEGTRRVVASSLTFDGQRPTPAQLAAALADAQGIRLPPAGRIQRVNPGAGDESWVFPVGTRLEHRFTWLDSASTLFELRLLERRADGAWAYGSYVRTADGKLRLLQQQETASFTLDFGGRPAAIGLTRLHPESCRRCHFAASPNHYPQLDTAGPCAFGPAHPALRREWAARFKAAHGYDPFLN